MTQREETKLLPQIQAQLPHKRLTSGPAAKRTTKHEGPLEEEQGAVARRGTNEPRSVSPK